MIDHVICFIQEPPETAQADSQHPPDSDTSAEPPGAAQADSQQFQDTDTSTQPPEEALADSQHFQETDTSTVPTQAARADVPQVQNEDTVTVSRRDKSTQLEEIGHNGHTYSKCGLQHIFGKQQGLSSNFTEEDCQFYTGLSKPVFDSLVKAATIESNKTFLKLSVEDQLLLSIMRMRFGLFYGHLARIFVLFISYVHKLFIYTLSVLQKVMKKVVVWLPRSLIRNSMPESFTLNGYEKTTGIIDCSEVFHQRPEKLLARAQTYSSYKAHNTVKFLTAIAPNGYMMFVSRAYGGRASDKFIMSDCGVEDLIGPGDEVMADRGFVLSTNLDIQGVKLNVPSFTRGKSQLSESEETQTSRIASVRIHVERAINRTKTFRIFKHALPIRSKKTISDMIFVCGGLCNLKGPLIARSVEGRDE
ncbi:uncharacterized protein LOC144120320 [Amblyomma americanum]